MFFSNNKCCIVILDMLYMTWIKGNNKNGEILFEELKIANRWTEYFNSEEEVDEDEKEEDRLNPENEDHNESIHNEG